MHPTPLFPKKRSVFSVKRHLRPLLLGALCAISQAGLAAEDGLVSLVNEVVPVLTKQGCNGGTCHGKATGQNGFKLSLFGFEANDDYAHLVYEQRGRRLIPAAPEESLLLTKGAAEIPHGGGKRLERGSAAYETLARWIGQGMPNDFEDPARAKLLSIRVTPSVLTMKAGQSQKLTVTATFADGLSKDVTHLTVLEATPKGMASLDETTGTLTMGNQPGSLSVMARYQGSVSVFRATLPLGAEVKSLPPERNFVDKAIFARLKEVGMPPSALCDDATFLRRVTLDLAGRLPTSEESTTFLADTAADKRARRIDFLLESGEYADTFANYWNFALRNRRVNNSETRDLAHLDGNFVFHAWIRESLYKNKPYDRFVRELLTATGQSADCPPVIWYRQVSTQIQQIEDTAQLFLGVRIQCAQCHHHPYEQWTQRDYYSLGAFFSQMDRRESPSRKDDYVISLKRIPAESPHKKTGEKLKPAAIGASIPEISPEDDARTALADWMADKANPFFAKSLVNRYWKILFNRGLVDPEDDMRETNPPSHPELLDALARDFIEGGYDLKRLLRTMTNSSAYQLDSTPNAHNGEDTQYFSRYYSRRLSAEVYMDAINQVTGSTDSWSNQPAGTRALQLPDDSYNNVGLLREFGRPESMTACTCERQTSASLGQSLLLASSVQIQEKLQVNAGMANRLAFDIKRTNEEKLQELYMAAYSRPAQPAEVEVALAFLEKSQSRPNAGPQRAWEDLVWVVLCSGEFLVNH